MIDWLPLLCVVLLLFALACLSVSSVWMVVAYRNAENRDDCDVDI